MKFHFIGGLDCPDWILAQISELNKLVPIEFKNWCQIICERLKFSQNEWTNKELTKLLGNSRELEFRSIKAMIAALSFILEKAVKNRCPVKDLENEMLQIGFSTEHSKQLSAIYAQEEKNLGLILSKRFLRDPSFSVVNTQQESDKILMNIRTSENTSMNLHIDKEKLELICQNIGSALNTIETYTAE